MDWTTNAPASSSLATVAEVVESWVRFDLLAAPRPQRRSGIGEKNLFPDFGRTWLAFLQEARGLQGIPYQYGVHRLRKAASRKDLLLLSQTALRPLHRAVLPASKMCRWEFLTKLQQFPCSQICPAIVQTI